MATNRGKLEIFSSLVLLIFASCLLLANVSHAQTNEVLGEVELRGATRVEKLAGVWVDGQYLGFLKELKGTKQILLLPGEHEITVRQSGYQDFNQKVALEPGQKVVLRVAMVRDPRAQYPTVTSKVKTLIRPSRAAVFVDEVFAGHADEFDGPGQVLLVAAGKHRILVTLPGYQAFETDVTLVANQQFLLKTDLIKTTIAKADSSMKQK